MKINGKSKRLTFIDRMMSITCQYTLDMSVSDTVRDVSDVRPLPVRGTHHRQTRKEIPLRNQLKRDKIA